MHVAAKSLIAMLTMQAAVVLASLTLPVLAPVASVDLGVAPELIGYYASFIFLTAMPASLVATSFVRRYGAVRVSQATLVSAALGVAILPIGMLPLLIVSGLLLGFAYGPPNPASAHLLVRHTPERLRGRVFSLKQISVPLGGAAAGLLLPLLHGALGWRLAAAVVAAVCLALALLTQAWRPRLDDERQPNAPILKAGLLSPLRLVLRQPRLRELALASGAFAAMQFCYSIFFVTYVTLQAELSLLKAGSALSVSLVVSIGGRLLWGSVADLVSPRMVLGALSVLMTLAATLTTQLSPDWPYWAILAVAGLFGATAASWNGVYLAEVAHHAPADQVVTATGGTMFCTYVGALAGPALFTLLTRWFDASAGFAFLAALTVVPALAFFRPPPARSPAAIRN